MGLPADSQTLGGYAAIYQNLRKHDPRFPSPEHLLSLIKIGNVDDVGEMTQVTDGSTLIRQIQVRPDPFSVTVMLRCIIFFFRTACGVR